MTTWWAISLSDTMVSSKSRGSTVSRKVESPGHGGGHLTWAEKGLICPETREILLELVAGDESEDGGGGGGAPRKFMVGHPATAESRGDKKTWWTLSESA